MPRIESLIFINAKPGIPKEHPVRRDVPEIVDPTVPLIQPAPQRPAEAPRAPQNPIREPAKVPA